MRRYEAKTEWDGRGSKVVWNDGENGILGNVYKSSESWRSAREWGGWVAPESRITGTRCIIGIRELS